MSYLIFFKKIKGRYRERGDISYNSHKVFHRWVFFSTAQCCRQQGNVHYFLSNYRSSLLQPAVSKKRCTFFMSEENYCGHLASNRPRLISRFCFHLNYFYVCQDYCGLPLYFCLPLLVYTVTGVVLCGREHGVLFSDPLCVSGWPQL